MIEQLEQIVAGIKTAIPELKKSVFLAVLDEEGRVLKRDKTSNEYVFAGINDHDDSYFYIRTRNEGKIEFSESSMSKKFAQFQNFFRIRYELRVVACLKNVDPICFEESIRFGVLNANLTSSASFANVSAVPIQSIIDPVAVVVAESPSKKAKPFSKNLSFVAFDFDIVGDRDLSLDNYCLNPCSGSSC
jgi:hypothetical protein